MKSILSFDISSSCIGYSLLEWDEITNDIKFIFCDYYKPTKKGDIFERLISTKLAIKSIIEKHKPDYIGIENIIEFMKGGSGAKTIIILALFNRMVGLTAYEYLNKSPQLFNVMQIRHGLKFNKDLPKKEEMPELVAKHLGINFPYEYKKDGITPKVESYDMADGVAVGLYYALTLSGKIKKKVKNESKRSSRTARNSSRRVKGRSKKSLSKTRAKTSP